MKTEEAFLKTQLQAHLFQALKHKTHVLEVLLLCTIKDTNIFEVDCNELV
jgi:hypothetical protein